MFAPDSTLEGGGFELPVPDERGYGLAFVCRVMGLLFGAQLACPSWSSSRRGLLPFEKVIEVMAGPCKARNLVIFSRAVAVTVGNVGNATWIEPVDCSELTFFPRASMWILV
jgi:hypothetical protein